MRLLIAFHLLAIAAAQEEHGAVGSVAPGEPTEPVDTEDEGSQQEGDPYVPPILPTQQEMPPAVDVVEPVRIVQQSQCLLDSAQTVSDALDASMFIWAAVARCGRNGEALKCSINVASAIQSVTSMTVILVKGLAQCGDVKTENQQCGISAGQMVQKVAGLTSKAGGIAQECMPHPSLPNNWGQGPAILCAVDVKDAAKNVFVVTKALLGLERNCNEDTNGRKPMRCATNALRVVSAFAGVGQYLAGAMAQCEADPGAINDKMARCAQETIGFTEQLSKIAQEGLEMARKCNQPAPQEPVLPPISTVPPTGEELIKEDEMGIEPERLYSAKKAALGQSVMAGSVNVLLAAFLPVTAIVGFVGGRFYGNRRTTQTREYNEI